MSQDNYYSKHYREILNIGAVGFVSNIVHKIMEPKPTTEIFNKVLEVGAGHGQHLKFVKHEYSKYFETDFRRENLPERSSDTKVISLEADATNLSAFTDSSIDRVIASCLIVHLGDPEAALLEWRRVCVGGG
jgi:ubiquinone/menaquinone biosynthesis C-methylase UbiE